MTGPLDVGDLRRKLNYNKETGEITRIGGKKHGKIATNMHRNGYLRVSFAGKYWLAHRLIWLWVTGVWPTEEVDHENLNKSDNRWTNLRLAVHSENMANRVAYSNNSSGLKGAWFNQRKQRWVSQIQKNGHRRSLGMFNSALDAHAAYSAAANDEFGEFARAA